MNGPRWDDPNLGAGTMVRAALWLVQEVGEGQTFTKEALRLAFPGVSQVDRRVRDLRAFDWVLDTNVNDITLLAEEQRFVSAGVPVWDNETRRKHASRPPTLTAKQRAAVLAADGYQCVSCGIAGGEVYIDAPNETAVLTISRRYVERDLNDTGVDLVTECKRCASGAPLRTYSLLEVLRGIEELPAEDRVRLMRWLERGRRVGTPVERAWNMIRSLPSDSRNDLMDMLRRRA